MVGLNINNSKDSNGFKGLQWTLSGDDAKPWIIEDVEDKIITALANTPIHSIYMEALLAEPWVANQFIDLLLG